MDSGPDAVAAASTGTQSSGASLSALPLQWAIALPEAIAPGEVHVWAMDLDRPDANSEKLLWTLSEEERQRANRFRFERDQNRYVAGRSALRAILASYLGVRPRALELAVDGHGKPSLAGAAAGTLHFNVTHADRLALIAVTQAGEVGIDVEAVQAMPDAESIAEGYFSAVERAALRALPASAKPLAFFRCWTRKEAYLKAVGLGLAAPLDRFDVSFTTDEPPVLLRIEGDSQAAATWSLHSLDPARGYEAALAIQSREVTLRCAAWAGAAS